MATSLKKAGRKPHGQSLAACQLLESRRMFATVTVNAGTTLKTVTPQYSATNLAWWQYEQNTTQMKTMVSAAGLKLFRLPGGSAADGFHFTGAAPYGGYDTLPIMANFVQAAGADAIVTVDYGSGGPEEAAAMLSYLNAPVGSNVNIGTGQVWDTSGVVSTKDFKTSGYWASLRAAKPLATDDGLNFLRINHAAPFAFSYYEIGNEEYATWETDYHSTTGKGGTSPSTYIGFAKSFQTFANQIDPHVKIGIDVSPALKYNMPDANWTSDLLTQSASQGFSPGFLSDHIYVTGLTDQNLLLHSVNDPSFKQDNYSSSWTARSSFYRSLINSKLGTTAGANVQLMATEFNSDINTKQADNLVGGLWVADALGGLMQTEYTAGIQWDLTNGYNALTTADTTHYGWRQGVDEGLISTGSANGASSGAYVPYPTYFAEQLVSKIDQSGASVIPVSSNDANLSTYGVKLSNGHIRLLVINKIATSTLSGAFNFANFVPSASATEWQYGIAEDNAQSQTTDGHASLTTTTPTLSITGTSATQNFPAYSMSVLDLTPAAPVVVASSFNYTTSPNTVSFSFDQPVSAASVVVGDLVLTNVDGGAVPTVSGVTLSSDGRTATFSLTTLADDNYTAALPIGSIASSYSGVTNTTAGQLSFFSLLGDLNHDRIVDIGDLGVLSQNWQKSGVGYAGGDINNDGIVDIADLGLLAQNWQKSVPAPSPAQTAAATPKAAVVFKPVSKAVVSPASKIKATSVQKNGIESRSSLALMALN